MYRTSIRMILNGIWIQTTFLNMPGIKRVKNICLTLAKATKAIFEVVFIGGAVSREQMNPPSELADSREPEQLSLSSCISQGIPLRLQRINVKDYGAFPSLVAERQPSRLEGRPSIQA